MYCKNRGSNGQNSVENQLGEQVLTNFDAKLSCETTFWSYEGQVEAAWRALGPLKEALREPKKATGDIGPVARGVQRGYIFGQLAPHKVT